MHYARESIYPVISEGIYGISLSNQVVLWEHQAIYVMNVTVYELQQA